MALSRSAQHNPTGYRSPPAGKRACPWCTRVVHAPLLLEDLLDLEAMFPTVAEIAVVDGGLAIADNFIQSQGNLDPVYTCIGSFVSAIFLRRACGYLLFTPPGRESLRQG